jgi:opacity protein-like surface antigen
LKVGLGLIRRFGADAVEPVSRAVDVSGAYAGALFGHGALVTDNAGPRETFDPTAQRAGYGAGFGLVAGCGMTFDNAVYVGGEVDAEISSLNWTQERSPSGRVYSIEKTHSFGASPRVGHGVNDGMLIYARGGPVVSGFETDFSISGGSVHASAQNWPQIRRRRQSGHDREPAVAAGPHPYRV